MSEIKIHVFHTGMVCVAPELPFGGEHCNPVKASGICYFLMEVMPKNLGKNS